MVSHRSTFSLLAIKQRLMRTESAWVVRAPFRWRGPEDDLVLNGLFIDKGPIRK